MRIPDVPHRCNARATANHVQPFPPNAVLTLHSYILSSPPFFHINFTKPSNGAPPPQRNGRNKGVGATAAAHPAKRQAGDDRGAPAAVLQPKAEPPTPASTQASDSPIMVIDSSDDDDDDDDAAQARASANTDGGSAAAGIQGGGGGGGSSSSIHAGSIIGGNPDGGASPAVSIVDLTSPSPAAAAYGGDDGGGGGGGCAATPVSSLKTGRKYRSSSPIQESTHWSKLTLVD